MAETIQNFIEGTLHIPGAWSVLLCSMIPIIELRGAIPLGVVMDLPLWLNFLVCVVGNMLPVPFILLFIKKFLSWCSNCRIKFLNKLANWLFKKAEKNRAKIEKYAFWGLTLFVAIPLPGTGAWTGALAAALMDMRFWRAVLCTFIGVVIAGVIMSLVSYGVVALF